MELLLLSATKWRQKSKVEFHLDEQTSSHRLAEEALWLNHSTADCVTEN
jgi:hypothetical protein